MAKKKESLRIVFRLTEREKKKIEAAAAKCGLPPVKNVMPCSGCL